MTSQNRRNGIVFMSAPLTDDLRLAFGAPQSTLSIVTSDEGVIGYVNSTYSR